MHCSEGAPPYWVCVCKWALDGGQPWTGEMDRAFVVSLFSTKLWLGGVHTNTRFVKHCQTDKVNIPPSNPGWWMGSEACIVQNIGSKGCYVTFHFVGAFSNTFWCSYACAMRNEWSPWNICKVVSNWACLSFIMLKRRSQQAWRNHIDEAGNWVT